MAEHGDATGAPTAETQARAAQAVRWLIAGNGTREVYDLAHDAWGVSTRQSDRYLALARQMLIDAWEVERLELTALLLSRADAVFRLAMSQNNSGAACAALGFIAKAARL